MNIQDEILTETRGSLGIITLNRPRAVNALSEDMLRGIDAALTEFESSGVLAVALVGAGDRGFCSGGDVVAIYRDATDGNPLEGQEFFRIEYALDYRISTFSKPVIAFMTGLCLGGGAGLSMGASHRVVTETTRFGMPEANIGFSPDVAGSYYMASAPGEMGTYMATTAQHITGADAVYGGFADYLVDSGKIDGIIEQLTGISSADEVGQRLARFHVEGESWHKKNAEWINEAFAGDDAEVIVARCQKLAEEESHPAAIAANALLHNSPTGVKTALACVRKAKNQTLLEVFETDVLTTMNAALGTDLVEGIRAQVIEKDRSPQWKPATLAEVTDISEFFEPIDGVAPLNLK